MKKKLYSLLSLLFAFCGLTATAQSVTDLSNLSSEKTYYLQCQRGSAYVSGGSLAGSSSSTTPSGDNYKFKFKVADADANTYYIYSIGGAGYITSSSTSSFVSSTSDATAFTIEGGQAAVDAGHVKSGTIVSDYPWMIIVPSSVAFQHNNQGGIAIDSWGVTWQSIDEGAQWKILDADIYDVVAAAETYLATPTECVGGYSSADITDLQSAYNAYTTTASDDNFTTLSSAVTAMGSKSTIAFSTDKYYVLKNYEAVNNPYVTCENSKFSSAGSLANNAVSRNSSSSTIAPSMLWKFTTATSGDAGTEPSNSLGLYTLSTANLPGYSVLCGTYQASNATFSATSAQAFYVAPCAAGNATYFLQTSAPTSDSDATAQTTYFNAHGGSNSLNMGLWNAGNNGTGGSSWYFIPVDDIPVSIGSTGYATLCLPFAVKVPSTTEFAGTVYVPTKNASDDKTIDLTTTIAAGSTIPADEPVILVKEGGATPKFTIDYNNTTVSKNSNNALTGVLLSTALEPNAGNYILKSGDSGVNFYLVNNTADDANNYLGANKAYFKYTGTDAQVISFNFADATGIHTAVTSTTAPEEYYDLQGRRVLYPAHGVFVKSNGQKVFIK